MADQLCEAKFESKRKDTRVSVGDGQRIAPACYLVTILQNPAAHIQISKDLPISKAKTFVVHGVVLILVSLPYQMPFIVHHSEFNFSGCRTTRSISYLGAASTLLDQKHVLLIGVVVVPLSRW